MALMQANNLPGQKKMMLGHRAGPDTHQNHPGHPAHLGHHSLMGHLQTDGCSTLLIRKDGDYHASRIMEGKDLEVNQNLQPKKKHKKSPSKVKEELEPMLPQMDLDLDGSLKVQKNFICDHCYGAFRSSYHLKRHVLTHTGEKPFACDSCDMRFIQRYHLDRHKRVHSGEKPYQCDRCHQKHESKLFIIFVMHQSHFQTFRCGRHVCTLAQEHNRRLLKYRICNTKESFSKNKTLACVYGT